MKELFLFFSIILSLNLSATTVDSANSLYKNNNYEAALKIYKMHIDTGLLEPALYFNAGNCYFKLNKNAEAIYHYEMAKLLDPNNKDIAFNLALANSKIVDKIEERTPFFLVQGYEQFVLLLSMDNWALLSILFFMLLLSSIFLFLFGRSVAVKKTALYSSVFLFVVMLLSILAASNQYNRMFNGDYAVLMQQVETVRSTPDTSGTALFVIHDGIKVKILDKVNGFARIELEDGKSGWIQESSLRLLKF